MLFLIIKEELLGNNLNSILKSYLLIWLNLIITLSVYLILFSWIRKYILKDNDEILEYSPCLFFLSVLIYIIFVVIKKKIAFEFYVNKIGLEEKNYRKSKTLRTFKKIISILYNKVSKRKNKKEYENESSFVDVNKSLVEILSIDYLMSDYYKNKISNASDKDKVKNLKKAIIKEFNKCNLFTSIILGLMIVILPHVLKWNLEIPFGDYLYQVIIFILFIRLISRSFEVFFAFLIDAVEEKKKSDLTSIDRIKLSITSYVELIILNAVVYFTVGEFKWKPDSGYHIIEGFMSAIATSVGVATFSDVNLTDDTNEVIQIVNIKYVMLLQLIVSFSLIVLNIAAYFSRDDNG